MNAAGALVRQRTRQGWMYASDALLAPVMTQMSQQREIIQRFTPKIQSIHWS